MTQDEIQAQPGETAQGEPQHDETTAQGLPEAAEPEPLLSVHTFIQRARPHRTVAALLASLHRDEKKTETDWREAAAGILERPAGGNA